LSRTGETGDLFVRDAPRPLADLLRPHSLDEVLGQDHLLGMDKPLSKMLDSHRLGSFILWGPPGCGKTTLARLVARQVQGDLEFEALSAVMSGVADLRKVFDRAIERRHAGRGTLLFVDEIHRFNRAQQDSFLAYLEDGTITLIGATTENPSFELNSALLSRCHLLTLHRLSAEALENLLRRAENFTGQSLTLMPESRSLLIQMADGDGRVLLNLVEVLVDAPRDPPYTSEQMVDIVQKRAPLYDKTGDEHYNLISALHKSLRGSDVDAALYWFARMLAGGEDPLYIVRRLVRCATEDIGLADPQALVQANAAREAYELLGSPEGELAIAQCVIYLATAPKSNAVYVAFKKARKAQQNYGSLMPPKHILNAPTQVMKESDYGAGYIYDHDTKEGFSGQNYFPENMPRQTFYRPCERGFEREILKRLDYWNKLRATSR
jgi:putative ATPase